MERTRLVRVLFLVGLAGAGCPAGPGDDADIGAGQAPTCSGPRGELHKAVVNGFQMPTVPAPCSIDIDGDGKPDNALMLVVGALKGSFDIQGSADGVIQHGDLVQLLTLQAESTTTAACAGLTLERGQRAAAPPVFDGSDRFIPDSAFPAARLPATVDKGRVETPLPARQGGAGVARVSLSLPAGYGIELPLPLWGAHLSGTAGPQGLGRGELHGAVRVDDVEGRLIPAVAQTITAYIRKGPDSADARSLIRTFETRAKCDMTPEKCCALHPLTCEITADEVRNNPLVRGILKPDVQMFDGDRFAPNPAADKPDSMSVGLCFTAVPAQF